MDGARGGPHSRARILSTQQTFSCPRNTMGQARDHMCRHFCSEQGKMEEKLRKEAPFPSPVKPSWQSAPGFAAWAGRGALGSTSGLAACCWAESRGLRPGFLCHGADTCAAGVSSAGVLPVGIRAARRRSFISTSLCFLPLKAATFLLTEHSPQAQGLPRVSRDSVCSPRGPPPVFSG